MGKRLGPNQARLCGFHTVFWLKLDGRVPQGDGSKSNIFVGRHIIAVPPWEPPVHLLHGAAHSLGGRRGGRGRHIGRVVVLHAGVGPGHGSPGRDQFNNRAGKTHLFWNILLHERQSCRLVAEFYRRHSSYAISVFFSATQAVQWAHSSICFYFHTSLIRCCHSWYLSKVKSMASPLSR